MQKFSKTDRIIFLMIGVLLFAGAFFTQDKAYAYGECSEYGIWATYDYLSGGCKCMSGYVFGKDFLGQTTCVSGDSVCHDKYGYNSRYDSLSSSCECSYGYVFGKDLIGRTQCISEDQSCKNQYGFNARSTFGGKCECGYGYGFSENSLGKTECVRLDSICEDKYGYNAEYDTLSDTCSCRSGYELTRVSYGSGLECKSCSSKYGIHSSYSYIGKKCECDSGYTLNDSNQCVEKQNNVYFTLKELDTDERKAIIKSDYDYRYYLISYNSGCYSSSFRRYLNHQIVVNLGTDFDLDTWDKIVLQDDNEVCDITRVERADSGTTLEPEEEESFYFIPKPSVTVPPQPIRSLVAPAPKVKKEFQFDEAKKKSFETKLSGEVNTSAALRKCPSTTECDVVRYFNPKTKVDILGSYNNEEWYQLNVMGAEPVLSGWMHSSIVNKIVIQEIKPQPTKQVENTNKISEANIADGEIQENMPWYKKVFGFFSNLFK